MEDRKEVIPSLLTRESMMAVCTGERSRPFELGSGRTGGKEEERGTVLAMVWI